MGSRSNRPFRLTVLTALVPLAFGSSCADPSEYDVVLYCAHDQIHAEPLVREFEAQGVVSP